MNVRACKALIFATLLLTPAPGRAEQDGKLQVLLLGDSTTLGSVCRTSVPEGPHLEDVVRGLLTAEKDLPPVNVINQGKDGESIHGLLEGRYDPVIAKLKGIDYVLIRYGLNDLVLREYFDKNFPEDLHKLIGRIRKDFPKATIIPMTVTPYRTLAEDTRINDLIARVAKDENLPLLDVFSRYQAELKHGPTMLNYRHYPLSKIPEAQRAWIAPFVRNDYVDVMDNRLDVHFRDLPGWFDDRHPNLAGYHVIGDTIARYLATTIRAAAKARAGATP